LRRVSDLINRGRSNPLASLFSSWTSRITYLEAGRVFVQLDASPAGVS